MTRRHIAFSCDGSRLVATLDQASGDTALLIVSGGNEIRAGAWNGQALLAARLASSGHPVLRFDRRGVGDSEGENRGFRHSGPDIAAALALLRAECPKVTRVVAFGNCDAAAALMLGAGCGADALVLANPWTIEDESAEAPPAALCAHYARRLASPAALLRLVTGKVSPARLLRSLLAMGRKPTPSTLGGEVARGLDRFGGQASLLLAGRDRTAQAFLAQWDKADPRLASCPGASHSFVEPEAQAWLDQQIIAALGTPHG